jgi:hypothetical protein
LNDFKGKQVPDLFLAQRKGFSPRIQWGQTPKLTLWRDGGEEEDN